MLLAPGVRSGRNHRCYFHWCVRSSHPPVLLPELSIAIANNCRCYWHQELCYFHWCVRSSHPCAPNIPNYTKCSCGTKITKQFKLVFAQAEAMWATFIHGITWNLEPNLRLTIWLWHKPTNPMIQTIKQSNTTRISRLHVTQRAHRHPYQQLMQLHMDWQSAIYNPQIHKSNTCLDSGISCLTGQWFFVLVLHIHRHSNPTQWTTSDQKKIIDSIGKNIQRVVMGPETGTKLSVLKDPSHHCPHKESSTGEVHLHLCDWPHDQCVFCHPCKRNCKH